MNESIGASARSVRAFSARKASFSRVWLTALLGLSPVVALSEAVRDVVVVLDVTPTLVGGRADLELLRNRLGVDAQSALGSLGLRAACSKPRFSDCTHLHVAYPATLREKLGEIQTQELLVLTPVAGFKEERRIYAATIDLKLLRRESTLRTVRTFHVTYRDWECDAACAKDSHAYAAEEFSSMIEYMLNLSLPERPYKLPSQWRDSEMVSKNTRWRNKCVGVDRDTLLVRDSGDRAWIGSVENGELWLSSVSWNGCATQ